MIKKVTAIFFLFTMFLYSNVIYAQDFKNIEIFDPKQDKVVKAIPSNKEINNMIVGLLKDIDGIYGKNDPVKDDGYAIKIPIDPVIQIQNIWINTTVEEVYIIIPEKEQPFFMIFENENRLICFPFTGDINALSKVLGFKLK